MWKNTSNSDGFTVWYAPYPESEFTGWPEESHHFGGN